MQYTIACNNYYKNKNEEKLNEVYNNKKNKIGRNSFSFAPKKEYISNLYNELFKNCENIDKELENLFNTKNVLLQSLGKPQFEISFNQYKEDLYSYYNKHYSEDLSDEEKSADLLAIAANQLLSNNIKPDKAITLFNKALSRYKELLLNINDRNKQGEIYLKMAEIYEKFPIQKNDLEFCYKEALTCFIDTHNNTKILETCKKLVELISMILQKVNG